jgi:hypothetical protein
LSFSSSDSALELWTWYRLDLSILLTLVNPQAAMMLEALVDQAVLKLSLGPTSTVKAFLSFLRKDVFRVMVGS